MKCVNRMKFVNGEKLAVEEDTGRHLEVYTVAGIQNELRLCGLFLLLDAVCVINVRGNNYGSVRLCFLFYHQCYYCGELLSVF